MCDEFTAPEWILMADSEPKTYKNAASQAEFIDLLSATDTWQDLEVECWRRCWREFVW